MGTPGQNDVTSEEFKLMAEHAGLGLAREELENLKPLYDIYFEYIKLLHSIDLRAQEIGVTFHPD